MKGQISILAILLMLFLASCNQENKKIKIDNKEFSIEFKIDGSINGLIDKEKSINYFDNSKKAYLMSVRIDGKFEFPNKMEKTEDLISLFYQSGIKATIKYLQKDTHSTFALIKIEGIPKVELITWGPYPTTISKTIGETVGVVRGEEFAIGIQSLNIKTLGGYPYQENDCMPEFDFFLQNDEFDVSSKGKPHVLYRIEAAKPTKNGSALQAFCRNRDKDRIIENLNHEKFVAPAYNDGGVIGSKIALFGCKVEKTLEVIGEIEVAEGLPHPMIDGQWGKISPSASAAYLIMAFTEDNFDQALETTKKAGLKYLYHYGRTFKSWGHFELYEGEFPNGYDGMKMCVDKAKEQGISIGLHTLSNFINTNDPYVTPIPDKRLAKVGSSVITSDIDEKQTEISIESPDFFNQYKNNSLRTVQIGNELIRYGKVSEKAPWKLLDCQRGAFKTNIDKHYKGDKISKLLDHGYKVFLSNTDLTIELSKNIANLNNKTGLRQTSFDGLEGNKSTGLGNYGEVMMPYVWYNALSDDVKSNLIVDASRTTHFFWHIFSRMNWGEPWYAGFRESQTEYRMKNQKYFRRNMIPGMLGWFKMTPEISLEDMEWMLTRSAAYDAGYAFVTSPVTIKTHGKSDEILEMIKQWEKARIGGAFPVDLKKEMENMDKEYHLESIGKNEWNLYPVTSEIFSHKKKVRQPGEPLYSTFKYNNPHDNQEVTLTIQALEETKCKKIYVEIDNYKKIEFPVTLSNNQIIRYNGGNTALLYDKNWNKIKTIQLKMKKMEIDKGDHSFAVDCIFLSGKKSKIKVEVKTIGGAVRLKI
ncbi:MAG: hypothetical protein DRJ07_01805 [Bacteroidetes bacterium]|nr:MAG: hypothetical protein DRJ07_01805 [Bacteroidota bacterium]